MTGGSDSPVERLSVGDRARKFTGDYVLDGTIVADFHKRDGKARRLVLEDDRGLLLIYSPRQLKRIDAKRPER